jgi:hypothetical protein
MRVARLAASLEALAVLAAIACAPSAALAGPICSPVCRSRPNFDFDADGKVDLIRSGATGIRVDLLDGTAVVGKGCFPNAGGSYVLKAVGRLNHDDNSDFVSQGNGAARVTFVSANGTGVAGTLFLGDGGGAWQVVGVADVNGDGIDEILFAGAGALRIANIASGAPAYSYLATGGGAWTYALAADLNGDASKDLVFRGSGAANGLIRVNRNGGVANVQFFPQGGGAWSLRLAADLDNDGVDDLVDVASNPPALGFDRVRIFDKLGNGTPTVIGFVPTGGGAFVLKASGDFSGDGKADLGYDGSASFRIVAMNGANALGAIFPPNDGGVFKLARMGDTNADGRSDLITTNAAGDVRIQLSNGPGATTKSALIAQAGGSGF